MNHTYYTIDCYTCDWLSLSEVLRNKLVCHFLYIKRSDVNATIWNFPIFLFLLIFFLSQNSCREKGDNGLLIAHVGETGVRRNGFRFPATSPNLKTLFYFFLHFYVFNMWRYPPYFLFNFRVNRLPVGDG
jgi:hypothetical protein